MKDGHKLNGKSLGRKYENLHIFFVLVLWFACGGFIEWNGMDIPILQRRWDIRYNPPINRETEQVMHNGVSKKYVVTELVWIQRRGRR